MRDSGFMPPKPDRDDDVDAISVDEPDVDTVAASNCSASTATPSLLCRPRNSNDLDDAAGSLATALGVGAMVALNASIVDAQSAEQ